ncbi:MAG TPA: NnrS family protein [Sphingomicrobium sp.]
MAAAHPFLRGGFRAFFFGGALWAVTALVLWLCVLAGAVSLPTGFDPLAWHRHEMLFGFVGAVIAGFLLTAIPNWTGRLPIAGRPLLALFLLWVAARLAVLFSAHVGPVPAALADVGFYLVLAALAAREVLEAKNRNLPIVGMVLLFGLADAADHASAAGLIEGDAGWQAAIALVVLMISLIGGRIIPSFTRNWMTKQGMKERLPTQSGRFDVFVIAATAIALLAWISAPAGMVAGALLIGAALLQIVRLARWGGVRTASDPLVLILHVGYLWVPVGLLLLGLGTAGMDIPRSAAIHALTAGAMATMILAVMTRASLGHTGRELRANVPTVLLYLLVTTGAIVRVAASLGIGTYRVGMDVAGTLWAGALILFLIAYGPILWRPRLGEAAA